MDNLFHSSVTELAPKIKNKEISSVELTRSLLQYARQLNPQTNAYISFREEQALAEAELADKLLQEGKYLGVYHGIPMGIKDNIYIENEISTMGSAIHRDFIAPQTAQVVQALQKAGAVLIGKLNLHEYAWGVTNDNPHFGPSRNPWNLNKITGGSSGGSGAAVASGASFASVGTDTAGSVRIPASCCGIVGLKPTQGLIRSQGVFPLAKSLDHVGPMAKKVEDVAALLEVLVDDKKQNYTNSLSGDLKGRKIGINTSYYLSNLDEKVEKLFWLEVDRLKSEGAEIVSVEIPSLEMAAFVGYMTILSESFALHKDNLETRIKEFGPDIQHLYSLGVPRSEDYNKAQQIARQLKKEFNQALEQVDVIISPTLPVLPPDVGSQWVEINGEKQDLNDHIMRFMFPSNITGLPSLSLPMGKASGLPVGLQLIGANYSEASLLNIAKGIQDHVLFDGRALHERLKTK